MNKAHNFSITLHIMCNSKMNKDEHILYPSKMNIFYILNYSYSKIFQNSGVLSPHVLSTNMTKAIRKNVYLSPIWEWGLFYYIKIIESQEG